MLNEINQHLPSGHGPFQSHQGGVVHLRADELRDFWESLIRAKDDGANLGDWVDAQLDAILTFYQGAVGAGYRTLLPLRVYHSATASGDYAQQVLDELILGKIVIIDLSLGPKRFYSSVPSGSSITLFKTQPGASQKITRRTKSRYSSKRRTGYSIVIE